MEIEATTQVCVPVDKGNLNVIVAMALGTRVLTVPTIDSLGMENDPIQALKAVASVLSDLNLIGMIIILGEEVFLEEDEEVDMLVVEEEGDLDH